mmetsp:Transcript_37329/g.106796  ORF Transcript_37329/g.106796 Transcript_37329/m.106796 type:complete len:118 (+) Transcript_37329:234-587(+)
MPTRASLRRSFLSSPALPFDLTIHQSRFQDTNPAMIQDTQYTHTHTHRDTEIDTDTQDTYRWMQVRKSLSNGRQTDTGHKRCTKGRRMHRAPFSYHTQDTHTHTLSEGGTTKREYGT